MSHQIYTKEPWKQILNYTFIPLMSAIERGNIVEVKKICKNYPNQINQQNIHNRTPLVLATMKPYIKNVFKIVEILLENGADPNIFDQFGWSALHYACMYSNIPNLYKIIEILLKYGVDANMITQNGCYWTPLTICGWKEGSVSATKILLEYGGNPNSVDFCGTTTLQHSLSSKNKIKILLEYGANITEEIANNDKLIEVRQEMCNKKRKSCDNENISNKKLKII